MSATIKRYDVTIEWGHGYAEEKPAGNWVDYDDHLASHAYDEEKERALFEAYMLTDCDPYHLRICPQTGYYENAFIISKWDGWKACAKSRAKAAGCE
jgi:hypothetical protein